jgi:hypothetical protein
MIYPIIFQGDIAVFEYNIVSEDMEQHFLQPIVKPEFIAEGKSGAGFSVNVLGHTAWRGETIAVNVMGQRVSTEAVISSFHSNRITKPITLHRTFEKEELRINASDRWRVYRKFYDGWGLLNAMIVSDRAISPRTDAMEVFIGAENIYDLIDGVFSRVSAGISPQIPLMPHWKTYLFRKGREAGKVRPTKGKGIQYYCVDLSDTFWSETVSEGLKNEALSWTAEATSVA